MKERPKRMVRRRDLLGVVLASAGAAVASSVTPEPAAAKSVDLKDKRRARYQAEFRGGPQLLSRQQLSGPLKELSLLIKKSEFRRGRGKIAGAETIGSSGDGWDRRAFLKHSGVTAGALAALGNLPLGSVRKAAAGPPAPVDAAVTARKNICTHCSVGCSVIAEVANGVWIGQEPDYDSPINRGSHCCKGAAVRDDVLSQRRLRYPVKLVNGQWVRISWDTAIDEIGDKLLDIRQKSGPDRRIFGAGPARQEALPPKFVRHR